MESENITENINKQTDANPVNNANQDAEVGAKTSIPEPTLSEDYKKLLSINLYKEASLKIQLRKHPNPEIDALFERRLDLTPSNFTMSPFALRILSSMIIIFLLGILFWGLIWLVGSILQLGFIIKSLSSLLAILVISGITMSIFQPLPIIDEKRLQHYLLNEVNNMQKTLEENEQ